MRRLVLHDATLSASDAHRVYPHASRYPDGPGVVAQHDHVACEVLVTNCNISENWEVAPQRLS